MSTAICPACNGKRQHLNYWMEPQPVVDNPPEAIECHPFVEDCGLCDGRGYVILTPERPLVFWQAIVRCRGKKTSELSLQDISDLGLMTEGFRDRMKFEGKIV